MNLTPAQFYFIKNEHKEKVEQYVNDTLSALKEWRDMQDTFQSILDKLITAPHELDGAETEAVIGMQNDIIYSQIYAAYCIGFHDGADSRE